jgi:hypothetical protein
MTFARDLTVGDVFRLNVYGCVLAAAPVAGGKLIKVRIELEDQGPRGPRGGSFVEGNSSLEFTDDGSMLEFLCRPGRKFSVYPDDDDDDDDDEDVDAPTPLTPVTVE